MEVLMVRLLVLLLILAGCASSPQNEMSEKATSYSSVNLEKVKTTCDQRKFSSALKALDIAYAENKGSAKYWNLLGYCYYLSGKPSIAILYLNKAIEFNGNFSPAYNNLAVIHEARGDYSKAEAALNMAINTSNPTRVSKENYALTLTKAGLISKSQETLGSTTNTNRGQMARAFNAYYQKQYKTASTYFSKLSANFQNHPGIALPYAYSLLKSGKKSSAMAAFAKVRGNLGPYQGFYRRLSSYLGKK